MIIGIDASLALGKPTGIGRYIINLLDNLSMIDIHNHYRLLYHYFRPVDRASFYHPRQGNFRVQKIRVPGRIMSWLCLNLNLPKVEHLLGKVELFHSTAFFPWPTQKAKLVLTVHDLSVFRFPQFHPQRMVNFYRRCFRNAIPSADRICADSENTKADLAELFKVPEQKITVIYPGVERRFAEAVWRQEGVVGKYDLDSPYILSVGALEPRKNLVGLLEAFCLLKESKGVPHQLVIVGGKGWLYQEFLDRLDSSKYRDQIRLLGYVPYGELPSLYHNAAAFVYPSFYEGFGLPVLEAMASGTPVVTSNNSSMLEIASGAAQLVDPANSEEIAWGIEKILFDRDYALMLSEKGKERAKSFDWRKTAIETLKVYQELGS